MTAAQPAVEAIDLDDPPKALRQLGAHAHQLRALARAADRFLAQGNADDHNTASWLVSTALALSGNMATDVDGLARALKERPADAALRQTVSDVRVRVHQLHAAVRAADHFMDQDAREDQETGGWLIAAALTLTHKLSAELDDATLAPRRPALDTKPIDPHDPVFTRRMAAATKPLRGAA